MAKGIDPDSAQTKHTDVVITPPVKSKDILSVASSGKTTLQFGTDPAHLKSVGVLPLSSVGDCGSRCWEGKNDLTS